VPANMSLNVTVSGYNQPEYPPLPGGAPLAPVVVATATVIGGHATYNPYKPVVNGKTFGVIGAYDGHRTSRAGKTLGRVVVDATWHHFFNVNLSGDRGSGTVVKRQGFNAPLNPGQADHYKMIKHYFRNIVYWLIPAKRRVKLFHATVTAMLRDAHFYELNPIRDIRKFKFDRLDLDTILAFAKLADAYFRRAHGACYRLQIIPPLLIEFDPFRKWWDRFEPIVNPWVTPFEKDPRPQFEGVGPLFADIVLGSAVLAAMQADADSGIDDSVTFNADIADKTFGLFQKRLPEAMKFGATQFAETLQAQTKHLNELTESLR
jgi:hypothetical protein